jgi:hypothetical protein
MTNILIKKRFFIISILYLFTLPYISFSQETEKTDSTIVKVVNTEKQLKLWYGSEDFPISDFVVLPNYTVLYNQEKGKIRLLKNENKLAIDEYNLREIKKIMLINGTNRSGQKIKYPLGPINAWFTIENDSTILAGTVTIKNSKYGSSYIRIGIRNNSFKIECLPYINIETDKSKYSINKTSYITSLYQINNQQILVTPYGFSDNDSNNNDNQINSEVYLKDSKGFFKNIYSIENTNSRLLNPVQIIVIDQFILLYDTTKDIVKIHNSKMDLISTINLNDIQILHEKPKRFFGKSFFWDAFTNELYYKVVYEENNKNARTLYKVELKPNLTFRKVLVLYTVGYTEKYINYGDFFTLSTKNRYIYTVSFKEK